HFDEPVGPYATGLKVVEQYDYTRSFSKAQPGRPLQTLVWYPAEGKDASMTVGDYVALLATETTFGKPTEPSAEAKELLAGLTPVLASRLRAVRDAPAASGRFPVVIYSPGFSSVAWENADLCEHLASHGYVVIATPNMGATTRAMTKDLAGLNTQAQDISFLVGYAQTLSNVDASRVAALGFSWGGLSNVFAAARDERIGALISLDGSLRFSPNYVQQAGDVHPERMTVPLLSIAGAPMTFEYQERVLNAAEFRGPNVLNAWTRGDLVDVHLLGFVHGHHTSMHQRNEVLWQSYFPSMQQADYDRDEATAGYGWLARYTLAFLNAYLKHDSVALAYLKKTPRENGAPRHFMTVSFRDASK
ncbi:alpha/beta hydrolase family protein, partial [Steroidobacter sp.]|uniref:alpha/beta hydrolase family protein n=1 Tax=Steroidobacter sp. TaxID=1978227 RepID=UPI001A420ABD